MPVLTKDTNFNMRMNRQKKTELESLYSRIGMTLPEAVNIFFENSLLVGGLPFNVRLPRYNQETEAAMQEARDIMAGKISPDSSGILQLASRRHTSSIASQLGWPVKTNQHVHGIARLSSTNCQRLA